MTAENVTDGATTTLSVGDVDSDIDVVCEDTRIEVALGRTLVETPDVILGASLTVTISGVRDLALNEASSSAEWTFRVGEFDFNQVCSIYNWGCLTFTNYQYIFLSYFY